MNFIDTRKRIAFRSLLNSGGGVSPEIGEFNNDNFDRASLGSNYAVVGVGNSWSPDGSELVLTGLSTGFAPNGLKYKFHHAWENWTQSVLFTVGFTPDSVSNGIGVGQHSDPLSTASSITCNLKTSTTGTYGALRLYKANSLQGTSGSTLTIVNGEQYEITIEKVVNYGGINTTFNCTATRISTGDKITLSVSLDNYWAGGAFALQHFGGTPITIQNWTINVQDKKNIPYLALGDSIAVGRVADTRGERYMNLFQPVNFAVSACGGDKIPAAANRVDSIIYQNPTNVILHIGTNDVDTYVALATIKSTYEAIRTVLVGGGINVIHLEMLPRISGGPYYGDIALFNAWLATQFPSDPIISLNASFTTNDPAWFSDNVHPNQLGHTAIKDAIVAGI